MRPAGLHHISKRKRLSKKKPKEFELYPSNKFWVRILDKSLLVFTTLGPLVTLPQVWKIFLLKNAAGISVISWALWAIMDIPWILYGFVHKDKPIMISYTLYLFTNLLVVLGGILYG